VAGTAGLAGLGSNDEEMFEDVKNILYTDSAVRVPARMLLCCLFHSHLSLHPLVRCYARGGAFPLCVCVCTHTRSLSARAWPEEGGLCFALTAVLLWV